MTLSPLHPAPSILPLYMPLQPACMEAGSGLIVLFVTITMVMVLPLIIAPIVLLLSSLLLLARATARSHGRAVFHIVDFTSTSGDRCIRRWY